jgi:hypothetical protein
MHLKKLRGGTQIGSYSWPEDGSVCEVPDQLGQELLALGGYEKAAVPAPKAAPAKAATSAPAAK